MPETPHAERVFLVEVVDREGESRRYEIGPMGLLVGRSSACDIILHSAQLAPRHAYFYVDGDRCFVEDLSTADDVFLNGRQTAKAELSENDTVRAGKLEMHIVLSDAARVPQAAEPAPPAPSQAEALALGPSVSPLAVAAFVFAVLAYQHWSFGLGGIVLAVFGLREMRRDGRMMGAGVAWGAIFIAVLGGWLNAWFEDVRPLLREARPSSANAPTEAPPTLSDREGQ